jgi:hypothetical protein
MGSTSAVADRGGVLRNAAVRAHLAGFITTAVTVVLGLGAQILVGFGTSYCNEAIDPAKVHAVRLWTFLIWASVSVVPALTAWGVRGARGRGWVAWLALAAFFVVMAVDGGLTAYPQEFCVF